MITSKVKRMGLFWTVTISNGSWEAASIDQLSKKLGISEEQLTDILKSHGAIKFTVQELDIIGWWEKEDAEKILPYFDHLIVMANMVNGGNE